MKITVLDGYAENPGDLTWDSLRKFGELEIYDRCKDEDEVIARLRDSEIAITNKTPLSRRVMDICDKLRFISVLATGYNIVDCAAAHEKGITVSNIPSYGTESVAQFAFALLLEICHRIGHHSDAVHAGRWENNADWCFWDYPLIELRGKTMGIIGFGRIGQAVGRIASAFGMKVLAHSRSRREQDIAEYVTLDELYARSDVISLHCPLFPETEGMINKESIAKMKDGVIIINNSRGGLIVEAELAEALNSGKVYAAGIDVVSSEPIKDSNPLLSAKNCIITPHISWAAKESRERIMSATYDNILAFLDGAPINTV